MAHRAMKSDEATPPIAVPSRLEDQRLQSRILVRIPRRLSRWSRSALVLSIVLVAIVCFVPWTQTVTVQGQLSAYSPTERPQEIHAQINGRIRTWHVNEGRTVQKGDLVLELEDVNPQFMAEDLLQRLDQSREALKRRRQAARDRAQILAERLEEMTTLTQAATAFGQGKSCRSRQ